MLDVDLAMGTPGSDIDDGFALALALSEPELQVDLVTTVNGNTDVATSTALTLDLLQRLGRGDVPVHRGAQVPLIRPATRIGSLPEGLRIREPHQTIAAVAMVEHVLAHPGEITLVAVGPLTNVALALRLHPDFGPGLKALVIMGGVYTKTTNPGTTNRADMPGEFNAWSDPEAAHIVLTSGVHARWVGLDVTLQVRMTRAEALEMTSSGQPFAAYAGEHTTAWIDHLNGDRQHPEDSCALHDPLAVAAVCHPELLTFADAYVQIELGDRSRGVMTADYLEHDGDLVANAEVAVAVDAVGFRDLFFSRVLAL